MPEETTAVREAGPADAAAVAALSGQLGYPTTPEESAARLAALAASGDDAVLVAVAPSGAVVGWVHVCGELRLETGRTAEIAGLVVDEGWRSRGVGAGLVAAAETWAAARGYPKIRVRSNVVRDRAHRFYGSRGYGRVKTQAVHTSRRLRHPGPHAGGLAPHRRAGASPRGGQPQRQGAAPDAAARPARGDPRSQGDDLRAAPDRE